MLSCQYFYLCSTDFIQWGLCMCYLLYRLGWWHWFHSTPFHSTTTPFHPQSSRHHHHPAREKEIFYFFIYFIASYELHSLPSFHDNIYDDFLGVTLQPENFPAQEPWTGAVLGPCLQWKKKSSLPADIFNFLAINFAKSTVALPVSRRQT